MALTIPPAFCTDQPYPFSILRKQMASLTSAGIVHAGDMSVSPASGLQVQIAAGEAYVQQTGATEGSEYNGLYYELNDAPANPFNTISAPLSNPRIDFVVLRVYDVTELGISGSSFARFEWVQGSENASASLSTMGPGLSNPGAPSLPASSLLRAYVLQTVGESSISSGNVLNSTTLSRQLLGGAWVALSTMGLNANLSNAGGGQYVPSARVEEDVIRFKGVLTATGGIATGFVLWTMPLGFRPSSIANPGGTGVHSSTLAPFTYAVATNGVVQGVAPALASGDLLYLDGLTYTLT